MAQTSRPPAPNRTVPYAEETAHSRIGLTTGIYGSQNVTRTFHVYCVNRWDNPVKVIGDLSAKNGGVKIGEAFPIQSVGTPSALTTGWGDGTFVLLYLTIVDHWVGTGVWTLQGFYGPSYLTSFPSQLWQFNIRGSNQSERVYTTIPTTYIDDEGVPRTLPSKGIGTPRYRKVLNATTETPAFTALHPDFGIVGLNLAGTGSDPTDAKLPRYIEGADTPRRISTVNFWKTIPTWNFGAVTSAMANKNFVNSDKVIVPTTSGTIYFADTLGIMMIDEISIDPIVANSAAQNSTDGPAFRVGITMKINTDGWQPRKRHTYKWDDGTESPLVAADGKFIDEEFGVIGETSFSGLLSSFI